MLAVSGLEVRYGSAVALRGVDLTVGPGEIVAVVGRNGAGKTTLLRAVTGLVSPARGRIALKGREIGGQPAHRIMRLGVAHVPQGRQVFGDQTVEDNLALGGFIHAVRDRQAVRRRMEEQYALFPRLAERRRQHAGTLSGGEQQMLAIARALMAGPRLLLLDEPSVGLAPALVREILTLLGRLRGEGLTILLVEQDAHAALRLADRGYVMETGRIVAEGPARALLTSDRLRRAYLGMV